jgi:hypothetical protein
MRQLCDLGLGREDLNRGPLGPKPWLQNHGPETPFIALRETLRPAVEQTLRSPLAGGHPGNTDRCLYRATPTAAPGVIMNPIGTGDPRSVYPDLGGLSKRSDVRSKARGNYGVGPSVICLSCLSNSPAHPRPCGSRLLSTAPLSLRTPQSSAAPGVGCSAGETALELRRY